MAKHRGSEWLIGVTYKGVRTERTLFQYGLTPAGRVQPGFVTPDSTRWTKVSGIRWSYSMFIPKVKQ